MIDIDQALAAYRQAVLNSSLDDNPIAWAAHYDGNTLLGSMGVHEMPDLDDAISHVVFGLMLPFSFTHSIQYSYVVIDEAAVQGRHWMKRRLVASRLLKLTDYVVTTHWVAPMRIADQDTLIGTPVKTWYKLPRVTEALSTLTDNRLSLDPGYTFDEAWSGCQATLEEIMS